MASNIIDNSGDLEDTKAQIVKILGCNFVHLSILSNC